MKRWLLAGLALLGVALALVAWHGYRILSEGGPSYRMALAARSRVHEGMTRTEAVALLEQDAWRHYHCEYGGGARHADLFLYGSHDLQVTGIAVIHSEAAEPGADARVVFVGTIEQDQLRFYDYCSSRDVPPTPSE